MSRRRNKEIYHSAMAVGTTGIAGEMAGLVGGLLSHNYHVGLAIALISGAMAIVAFLIAGLSQAI